MAVRFPGDAAAANGFGCRSLHEWEVWLLFEANIPAPPDMRVEPTGWRLGNGGVPIPSVPDVEARPAIFAAKVDRVRASLTEEQRTLPQYAADNHASCAAYFQHRQAQRLASTNGAPEVGGVKNSEGRHVWWGAPGRMLHDVSEYLEGGNDPPLVPRRSAGQWMPRMFGSSSTSSSHSSPRSSSHSSVSSVVFGVEAEPAAEMPLGRRTRSTDIVINEGGQRASSSAPPCCVKPKTGPELAAVKTEPGHAPVKTEPGIAGRELDDATALKCTCDDWAHMEMERQHRALEQFEARHRGHDEGGFVVLDDSDDEAPPPPPVRHGDAGQGSSRGGRVKEEKAADDDGEDGGDVGDFAALSDFFDP